jgi:hypothetical protein
MISDHDFDVELGFVRAHAAGSLAGVFGPDSVAWRVNRDAAIFLGAGRALLLQLAHPWVATAVSEHSQVFANPIDSSIAPSSLCSRWSSARLIKRWERHDAFTGGMPQSPASCGAL